jgi:hypothetical protein
MIPSSAGKSESFSEIVPRSASQAGEAQARILHFSVTHVRGKFCGRFI